MFLAADTVKEVAEAAAFDDEFTVREPVFFTAADLCRNPVLRKFRLQFLKGGIGDIAQEGPHILELFRGDDLFQACLPVFAVPVGRALREVPAEIRVIYPEAAQQAEGHDDHDEGERQCHDDRHGLQCFKPARVEQADGQHGEHASPEDALPSRESALTLRGDGVDDEYAGIGRRDEENRDDQDGYKRCDGRKRQLVEEQE